MYPFIETIRIEQGQALNLAHHDRRLNDTRAHFWPGSHTLHLADYLAPPSGEGILKARVAYGATGIGPISYTPYTLRPVRSLALVADDNIDYTYKSADRRCLEQLFSQRGACDDILIVRQGLLTDTSIANIALTDGTRWYTPAHPLLPGTRRAALLAQGILHPRMLTPRDLSAFSAIRLFNALIGWGELELPVQAVAL